MSAAAIARIALAGAVVWAADAAPARAEHDAASPAQEQIEEMIHDYLLSHPDVMLEVFDILRTREEARTSAAAKDQIAAHRATLYDDPSSPVGGNPDGDVVLVEFFDYHCGYCKRVLDDVNQVIAEDSGVRIVYKEFPILREESVLAARAALAGHRIDPDKYVAFHVSLMDSRATLTEARIMRIAREVGYDPDRIRAEMDAAEIAEALERNQALARALGVNGTPSFVIGDRLIPGAVDIDALRDLIAQARAAG